MRDKDAISLIRNQVNATPHTAVDYAQILEQIGDLPLVLIGEASHGTHEFYEVRAEITKQLIKKKGFQAVAVESDWPDAQRVNRFVRGRGDDIMPVQALSEFVRFPRWMWRNTVVEEFVGWLREHNRRSGADTGFFGLDLYSLYSSRAEVIRYLERVDANAAQRARARYACFDHFGGDPQAYGFAAGVNERDSCEEDVVQQLLDLQRKSWDYMHRDGRAAEDDFFSAEQNARLVRNAEEYYRSMYRGRVNTWNLRDRHMAETLHALMAWLDGRYGLSKIVVWEHNSHLGDARATDMSLRGEFNVGQLVRERYPGRSFHIGLTTYIGTVTAAWDWDGEAETKRVRPGLKGSWEELFHQTENPRFCLNFRNFPDLVSGLADERLERAIGVIYRPETERISHYFPCRIAEQFDAVIHLDETRALQPLDALSELTREEMPETYPSGV